jgi:hypothetical protein
MGREAYIPGEDPMDHLPWKPGTWGREMYAQDFIDGWKEAEEEEREGDDVEEVCPYCGK